MPPRPRTQRGRTSGTSMSLTPLIPATPASVEPDVSMTLAPVEPTLPRNENSEDLCEYDSDGVRIRKGRSAATPALIQCYVTFYILGLISHRGCVVGRW
jgi:hypothetical protein